MSKRNHGLSETRVYSIWRNMKTRCYNSKVEYYKYYGAKGIIVCDEWKNDFKSFYNWAGWNGYEKNLTLDRINNDGNYEPENCKWSTPAEQAMNRNWKGSKSGEMYIRRDKHSHKWRVRIMGKNYGRRKELSDAIDLRNKIVERMKEKADMIESL